MPNKLHLRIREARKKAGYSREKAGKLLDVNPKTLAGYENAVARPKPETLQKMAELYKVTLDYLIAGKLSKYTENIGTDRLQGVLGTSIPLGDFIMIPVVPEENAGNQNAAIAMYPVDTAIVPDIAEKKDEYIYVRMESDQMVGAGIQKNSLVLIHLGERPAPGEIGVVQVNNKSYLRRLYFRPESITMAPDNQDYPPEVIDPLEAKIIGRATMVVSRL